MCNFVIEQHCTLCSLQIVTSLFSNAELLAANNGQQNNPGLIRSRIFGADSRYRAELMRSRFGNAAFFIFDAYTPIANGPLKGLPDCVFQTEDEQALLAKVSELTRTEAAVA